MSLIPPLHRLENLRRRRTSIILAGPYLATPELKQLASRRIAALDREIGKLAFQIEQQITTMESNDAKNTRDPSHDNNGRRR